MEWNGKGVVGNVSVFVLIMVWVVGTNNYYSKYILKSNLKWRIIWASKKSAVNLGYHKDVNVQSKEETYNNKFFFF